MDGTKKKKKNNVATSQTQLLALLYLVLELIFTERSMTHPPSYECFHCS